MPETTCYAELLVRSGAGYQLFRKTVRAGTLTGAIAAIQEWAFPMLRAAEPPRWKDDFGSHLCLRFWEECPKDKVFEAARDRLAETAKRKAAQLNQEWGPGSAVPMPGDAPVDPAQ